MASNQCCGGSKPPPEETSCCKDEQPCCKEEKPCCGGEPTEEPKKSSEEPQEQQSGGTCGKSCTSCGVKRAPTDAEVRELVRGGYADISKKTATRDEKETKVASHVAQGMGYTEEELSSIPAEANMGLQCGNPTQLAGLKAGEVVVDLGSGGGIDIFLASRLVGPAGKAIGIDMTTEMIEQARASAAKGGITNVEFYQADITAMPLPENTADVIISNCVINLAPNKMDVFKEMFRVLKPGGRVAVSDVVLTEKPMPEDIRASAALLIGCVAGAIPTSQYVEGLKAVGFKDVAVVNGGQDLNAMWRPDKDPNACASCCGVTADDIPKDMEQFDINDYVYSGKITAVKP